MVLSCPEVQNDSILFPGLPGKRIYTHDSAYKNAVIAPSANLESIQGEADIISSFCVSFGDDIAIQKWSPTANRNYKYTGGLDSTDITASKISTTGSSGAEILDYPEHNKQNIKIYVLCEDKQLHVCPGTEAILRTHLPPSPQLKNETID